jgi:RimJ/RimL family protein N-acetyltransferase
MKMFQNNRRDVSDLKTERLRLVAITVPMLDAERRADGSFAGLLGAKVTGEWPPEHWEPHVLDFIQKQTQDDERTAGWNRYVLLKGRFWEKPTLIGAVGGFAKPRGDVEIGYSTLPAFQRRGYATEAARALMEMLFADEKVVSVCAQTFPSLPESIKVMERCGMSFVGDGDDPGTVRYRRSRISS